MNATKLEGLSLILRLKLKTEIDSQLWSISDLICDAYIKKNTLDN